MAGISGKRIDPSFLLMYPPMAFWPEDSAKPDGSLGLLYLAGALRSRGYDVEIMDAVVGPPPPPGSSLADTFYRTERLSDGRVRIGMTLSEILAAVRDFDVVGLTNLYTAQAPPAAEVAAAVKAAYPEKLVMVGGANARHMADWFLRAGPIWCSCRKRKPAYWRSASICGAAPAIFPMFPALRSGRTGRCVPTRRGRLRASWTIWRSPRGIWPRWKGTGTSLVRMAAGSTWKTGSGMPA